MVEKYELKTYQMCGSNLEFLHQKTGNDYTEYWWRLFRMLETREQISQCYILFDFTTSSG